MPYLVRPSFLLRRPPGDFIIMTLTAPLSIYIKLFMFIGELMCELISWWYPIDLFHKSHNAQVPNPIMHHFVTEICAWVHISVTDWHIVGYLSDALWDLWDGSKLSQQCQGPSQYKDGLFRYGYFHYKDKAVMRLSYLYNGNSYTIKTTCLYWDSPLVADVHVLHSVHVGDMPAVCLTYTRHIGWAGILLGTGMPRGMGV